MFGCADCGGTCGQKMAGLGCAECGGTCGGAKPLSGLAFLDFSKLPATGNEKLTREVGQVRDYAKTVVILQAVASLAAAGVLYIQWRTYCDNKKKRSRSKR